jgi:hypothetical protein
LTLIFQFHHVKLRSYKFRHQIDIKIHLLDISVWLDIKKTTICCSKTLRYFLSDAKALVCLVGSFVCINLILYGVNSWALFVNICAQFFLIKPLRSGNVSTSVFLTVINLFIDIHAHSQVKKHICTSTVKLFFNQSRFQ